MRLLLVILLLFLSVGCVQKNEKEIKISLVEFSAKCGSGENFYEVNKENEGLLVRFGVNLPNPCYEARAIIENGNLIIKLERREGVCIQCLAYGEGRVKVEGKSDLNIQVLLDDSKINLERK